MTKHVEGFGLMLLLVVAGFLAVSQVHAALSYHEMNAKGVGKDCAVALRKLRSLAGRK